MKMTLLLCRSVGLIADKRVNQECLGVGDRGRGAVTLPPLGINSD